MLSTGFMLIGNDVKLNSPSSLIGQALTEILQHPECARDALRVLLHLVRGPREPLTRAFQGGQGSPSPGLSMEQKKQKMLGNVREGVAGGFCHTRGDERAGRDVVPRRLWVKPVGPRGGHDVRCHTDGCSSPHQGSEGGGSPGVTWSEGTHHSHSWAMWLWAGVLGSEPRFPHLEGRIKL